MPFKHSGTGASELPKLRDPAAPLGRAVTISVGPVLLEGDLAIPKGAAGVVLFAHGSGSSRHSPRNKFVAAELRKAGMATLLMDLLTREEERIEEVTGRLRFDIELLSHRLSGASTWLEIQRETVALPLGYFGASTGAAAALVAAARQPQRVHAIVSRGGRPDMADKSLSAVQAPTLLIVGGDDDTVVDLNRQAYAQLQCTKELKIVPGATHLFDEPGTLEEVARLAAGWFSRHLGGNAATEWEGT